MFGLRFPSFKVWLPAVAGLILASGTALAGHGGGGHGGGFHAGGFHAGSFHAGGFHAGGFHPGAVGGFHHAGFAAVRPGVARSFVHPGVAAGFVRPGVAGSFVRPGIAGGFVRPGVAAFNRNVFVGPRFFGTPFLFGRGYGFGYGLGYGGYGWGYPYYYGYGGYPYYYGYGGYPYGYGNTYAYNPPLSEDYSSYYPPQPQTPPNDNTARLMVVVPENAELWFNGTKTSQTGTQREFVSPALASGKSYTYDIKARWTENGKPVEHTRSVHVQANAGFVVDFTKPETPSAPEK